MFTKEQFPSIQKLRIYRMKLVNAERLNKNMCQSIDIIAMQIADSIGVK